MSKPLVPLPTTFKIITKEAGGYCVLERLQYKKHQEQQAFAQFHPFVYGCWDNVKLVLVRKVEETFV